MHTCHTIHTMPCTSELPSVLPYFFSCFLLDFLSNINLHFHSSCYTSLLPFELPCIPSSVFQNFLSYFLLYFLLNFLSNIIPHFHPSCHSSLIPYELPSMLHCLFLYILSNFLPCKLLCAFSFVPQIFACILVLPFSLPPVISLSYLTRNPSHWLVTSALTLSLTHRLI